MTAFWWSVEQVFTRSLTVTVICNRPRRRRLKAFTIDSKIIRLISRRVVVFPAAAARQFFDGECDSANLKIYLHLCGLLGKGTEGFSVDKILHTPLPLLSFAL